MLHWEKNYIPFSFNPHFIIFQSTFTVSVCVCAYDSVRARVCKYHWTAIWNNHLTIHRSSYSGNHIIIFDEFHYWYLVVIPSCHTDLVNFYLKATKHWIQSQKRHCLHYFVCRLRIFLYIFNCLSFVCFVTWEYCHPFYFINAQIFFSFKLTI